MTPAQTIKLAEAKTYLAGFDSVAQHKLGALLELINELNLQLAKSDQAVLIGAETIASQHKEAMEIRAIIASASGAPADETTLSALRRGVEIGKKNAERLKIVERELDALHKYREQAETAVANSVTILRQAGLHGIDQMLNSGCSANACISELVKHHQSLNGLYQSARKRIADLEKGDQRAMAEAWSAVYQALTSRNGQFTPAYLATSNVTTLIGKQHALAMVEWLHQHSAQSEAKIRLDDAFSELVGFARTIRPGIVHWENKSPDWVVRVVEAQFAHLSKRKNHYKALFYASACPGSTVEANGKTYRVMEGQKLQMTTFVKGRQCGVSAPLHGHGLQLLQERLDAFTAAVRDGEMAINNLTAAANAKAKTTMMLRNCLTAEDIRAVLENALQPCGGLVKSFSIPVKQSLHQFELNVEIVVPTPAA